MHLTSVTIRDLRSFRQLSWELPDSNLKGWHVIIGDNGSGKSTFLRAISLALCGPMQVLGLREDWDTWLRESADCGSAAVRVSDETRWDKWAGGGRPLKNFSPSSQFALRRNDDGHAQVTRGNNRHNPDRHLSGVANLVGFQQPTVPFAVFPVAMLNKRNFSIRIRFLAGT